MSHIEIDLTKYEAIVIPEDIKTKLDGMSNNNNRGRRAPFTPVQDKILLEYWDVKKHYEIAELIGYHVDTCRKRYQELTR